jgi:protocatechuate 3,4-dioxygenase, alpha subunit
MSTLGQTPSQTVGPYFGMRLAGHGQHVVAGPGTPGEHIHLEGCVFDGDGNFIEDALLELWQADPDGRYVTAATVASGVRGFTGFGRAETAFDTGLYRFDTVRPGRVPARGGGLQAPHLNLIVQARGALNPVFTRVYFADEYQANAEDPILRSIAAPRRATMLASRSGDTFRFDVRFQGADETVFLEF